jgi:hypothetical protein
MIIQEFLDEKKDVIKKGDTYYLFFDKWWLIWKSSKKYSFLTIQNNLVSPFIKVIIPTSLESEILFDTLKTLDVVLTNIMGKKKQ